MVGAPVALSLGVPLGTWLGAALVLALAAKRHGFSAGRARANIGNEARWYGRCTT